MTANKDPHPHAIAKTSTQYCTDLHMMGKWLLSFPSPMPSFCRSALLGNRFWDAPAGATVGWWCGQSQWWHSGLSGSCIMTITITPNINNDRDYANYEYKFMA